MLRSLSSRTAGAIASIPLVVVGFAACSDAFVVVDAGPPPVNVIPLDGAVPPVHDAAQDHATTLPVDASTPMDAGAVTLFDDFDRPDGAVLGPWDGVSSKSGAITLVPTGAAGEPGRWLRAAIVEPDGGGASYALLFRKLPQVLLTGKATFTLKIDVAEPSVPDGGAVDTMHVFGVEIPCAGAVNHLLRVGLRKRADSIALVAVSHYLPGPYRASGESVVRLTTGRSYRIGVEFDATSPAPGKPMVNVSVDGVVAASIDGTTETAVTHMTSTKFLVGSQGNYGASWTLLVDDIDIVARP